MSNQRSNETSEGNPISTVASYLATLCVTYFFIAAYRDVLVSPGGFNEVASIVYVFAAAPLFAGLLNLSRAHRLLSFLGGASVLCAPLIQLTAPLSGYYLYEYLIMGGFGFYFVSRLSAIGVRPSPHAHVAVFSAAFLTAPILHLSMRSADIAQSNTVICILIAVGALGLIVDSLHREAAVAPSDSVGGKPRRNIAAGFSIFLIAVPAHYIFQWVLKPELISGVTNVSYRAVSTGVKCAMLAAVVSTIGFAYRRRTGQFYFVFCALAAFATTVFGCFFELPTGVASLMLILLSLAAIAFSYPAILMYFESQNVPGRPIFISLGVTGACFSMLGLNVYLIEHHEPTLNWIVMSFLTIGLIGVAASNYKSESRSSGNGPVLPIKFAAVFAIAVAVIFAAFSGWSGHAPAKNAGRKVFACLYTWYGVPEKPFGEFGFETLRRPATANAWKLEPSATGAKLEVLRVGPERIPMVVATGNPGSRFAIRSAADTTLLNIQSRQYFAFRSVFEGKGSFYIRKDGVRYEKTLARGNSKNLFVFPQQFSHATETGPNEMGFETMCPKSGPCRVGVSELRVSNWKHWDEDYHVAKINGQWRNDPPDTLAAAHRANYTGRPWPEIASYSPDGYYDSWDPRVVRSQLQLMQKAGVDVVMIMHPHSPAIVQAIIDTLDELHSPLQIAYYSHKEINTPGVGLDIIKRFGSNPRYLKVDGRPVWFIGPTGLQEKPLKVYEKEFAELRRKSNAFIVGDQYAPPKEEMLPFLDGHYYYDTTGEHRARWGAPNIPVAQPDGHYITGHGHLDILFRAISSIVHARRQVFVAVVIPGADNTRVHDFTNSPFYDRRPGTIVKRQHGATYSETWRAAISSRADWVCIVSWNELHEGTEIEPTKEDGVFYVEQTAYWANAFRMGEEPR